MRLKSVYFIKRFLIVILLAAVMACVGSAPEQPVLFITLSASSLLLTHLIWKSAQRDEKRLHRRRLRLCSESRRAPQSLKRAA